MAVRSLEVLLLEDDPDDVCLAELALRQDPLVNYNITCFSRVKDIKTQTEKTWDVILLDLNLPDSNGLKTLSLVLNIYECPIIVLTGLKSELIGEKAIQLGAEDYLPKEEITTTLLSRTIRLAIERHSLIAKLRNMAHVDSLTLLSNRADYDLKLDSVFEQAKRHKSRFAVFIMDLNKFKVINDQLGHQAGDQALMQIATRLKQRARKSDYLARIGGDEFALIIPMLQDGHACESIAKDFIACSEEPLLVYSNGQVHEVSLGLSIGIAIYPDNGQSMSEIVGQADAAMYEAKKASPESRYIFL